MAWNLRKRSQTNIQSSIIDIYDDPMDVPVQKMSFSVYQWKSSNEADGKWSSNCMHFSYLEDGQLWLEFDIPNSHLFIPKKWTEIATTPSIHNEMVAYHNKYKRNVPIWIWKKFQIGLKDIEAQMSYGIGDIGVADGKFIEIFEVQSGGPIYKGKVLNVSISNEFYSNPIEIVYVCHSDINILLCKQQRTGSTNLESLFKAQAIHYKQLNKQHRKSDKSNNKERMKCLRAGILKLIKKEATGRTTTDIDCTKKDFEGKGKLKEYVTSVIGGAWKSTKASDTIDMSNGQFGKLFSKKYLKKKISKTQSYDVEDGYSYLRFNKKKQKLYLSVNVIESVGGVVMKGSQKKRDEIMKKIRKDKKAAKKATRKASKQSK